MYRLTAIVMRAYHTVLACILLVMLFAGYRTERTTYTEENCGMPVFLRTPPRAPAMQTPPPKRGTEARARTDKRYTGLRSRRVSWRQTTIATTGQSNIERSTARADDLMAYAQSPSSGLSARDQESGVWGGTPQKV
jgi:hypothetical protein